MRKVEISSLHSNYLFFVHVSMTYEGMKNENGKSLVVSPLHSVPASKQSFRFKSFSRFLSSAFYSSCLSLKAICVSLIVEKLNSHVRIMDRLEVTDKCMWENWFNNVTMNKLLRVKLIDFFKALHKKSKFKINS
jgi:hypothetical protein